jgi:hypothetical protein
MRSQFVNKKSELTTQLNEYAAANCWVLRSRIACNCKQHNLRYGIVAILHTTVIAKVVRCRSCAKVVAI